jgi:NADH-quinone oxidoreductase subunit E
MKTLVGQDADRWHPTGGTRIDGAEGDMAWMINKAVGAALERRAEAYLDEAMKADLEANILTRYPTRRAAALPVLQAIQERYGWIPQQAIDEVAAFLGVQPAELMDTASFYEMFWLRPKGKYLVMVCQSISCELCGHHGLLEVLEQKLGIEAGQTTADGKFTLAHVECLGSCGTAPCAMINQKLYEKLTPQKLCAVIDTLA